MNSAGRRVREDIVAQVARNAQTREATLAELRAAVTAAAAQGPRQQLIASRALFDAERALRRSRHGGRTRP